MKAKVFFVIDEVGAVPDNLAEFIKERLESQEKYRLERLKRLENKKDSCKLLKNGLTIEA